MALPDDYNAPATVNHPGYDKIAGQGFHTDPSRINTAGRPKGSRNRATIVREALEAIMAGSDQMVVDAITAAAIAKAMTGDIPAFNSLLDSGYGKLTDKQVIAGDPDAPLKAEVKHLPPDEAYKRIL